MENSLSAWRLSSFLSTFTVALTKNINSASKPSLAYVLKPLQCHHYHCGSAGSFRGLFPESQSGWPPCVPGHLGFQRVWLRGSSPRARLEAPSVPEAPSACGGVLSSTGLPLSLPEHILQLLMQGSSTAKKWPTHLIADKIHSNVPTLYKGFPFSATSERKKKWHAKFSEKEQASGSAVEKVACFGVSLPSGSRGTRRNWAVCMHFAAPTEILKLLGTRLEDTWSTSRAIWPGILSWVAP